MSGPMQPMERFSIEGRVAVVTGATGLIGKEHCRALQNAGARVVVSDIDETRCFAFASELGNDAIPLVMDVANPASVRQAHDRLMGLTGQVDILVNNAAMNDMFENPSLALEQSKLENYPFEMWNKMLQVNVSGVFLCSQIFGTTMSKAGKGSIINVASTYGIVAPDQTLYLDEKGNQKFFKSIAYPATKGAVISMTRFLAAYWGKAGVRVNTLSPGGVENGQDEFFKANYSKKTPLGRMANATDYQGALIFLASDASSYMTGSNLVVDGGWTIW